VCFKKYECVCFECAFGFLNRINALKTYIFYCFVSKKKIVNFTNKNFYSKIKLKNFFQIFFKYFHHRFGRNVSKPLIFNIFFITNNNIVFFLQKSITYR
jgi:hypothetical protein